ncbi:MAG: insulinase family protein [Pyrinomonadaceae bacterium]
MTIADRAIAARLCGAHPYGRPAVGTVESLARVNRADLIFARERFLHPNNATLVVIGEIDENRVMTTLRQLLGFWRRSESVAPATFKQPSSFDARTLIIDLPGAASSEIRLAARGFSQGSREAAAAELLANVALERWRRALPESQELPLFVRHEARALSGIFVMGATVPAVLTGKALGTARVVARSLGATPLSPTELLQAKSEARSRLTKDAPQQQHLTLAANWLDADQFKLDQNYDRLRSIDGLTAEEVRQTAAKLFPDEHAAAVAVGSAAQLSSQLGQLGSIEMLGAAKAAAPAAGVTIPTPPFEIATGTPLKTPDKLRAYFD